MKNRTYLIVSIFILVVGLAGGYLYYFYTTSFINCLLYSDLSTVQNMVQNGADIQQKKHGIGALHLLAKIKVFRTKDAKSGKINYAEYSKIAKYLIDCGLNPNVIDEHGRSPLHWALCFSYYEMATVLIEAGANVNQKDVHGLCPLQMAIESFAPIDIIKLLILKGADVNAKDSFGSTPLHEAVLGNDISVIKLLVDHGSSIDTKDNEGDTPLSLAVAFKRKEVVDLFLSCAKTKSD